VTVDVPPAAGEGESEKGDSTKTVDDVLRELLVGDLKVRVDPVSGQAIPDGEGAGAREDHP